MVPDTSQLLLMGFTAREAAWIGMVSVLYLVISWLPLLWPLIASHRRRASFPRRWLFGLTVLTLVYGWMIAFAMLVSVPMAAYETFIAPQLAAYGFHLTDPMLRAHRFVVAYWWVALPFATLASTFFLTRWLLPAWPGICLAFNPATPAPRTTHLPRD